MRNVVASKPRTVAGKILFALRDRLLEIRGQGEFVFDLEGRVNLRRVDADLDLPQGSPPECFLYRRLGGGTTRVKSPVDGNFWDVTTIYDVVIVVPASSRSTVEAEEALGDLHRAIEIVGDVYIRDAETGFNLLGQELAVVDLQVDDVLAALPYDFVGIGIATTYPHKYGAPNYVQP